MSVSVFLSGGNRSSGYRFDRRVLAILNRQDQGGKCVTWPEIKALGRYRSHTTCRKVFVLTGVLPSLSRDEVKDLIEAAGGKVSGSVSKKPHMVGDRHMAHAKTTRRKQAAPVRRAAKTLVVNFDVVRSIAHTLPGVEDGTSYGTPALKVRGKLLARLHQDGDAFVLRMEFLDRHILMQADSEAFFITDHYRDYPWVLVRFAAVRHDTLLELLERAWRLVAPKKLLSQYAQDSR